MANDGGDLDLNGFCRPKQGGLTDLARKLLKIESKPIKPVELGPEQLNDISRFFQWIVLADHLNGE